MVGVCTEACDLKQGTSKFWSLLGRDYESWGYSYYGIYDNYLFHIIGDMSMSLFFKSRTFTKPITKVNSFKFYPV